MSFPSLLIWLRNQLNCTLGDAAEEVAEYVLSMQDDGDVQEYLSEIGVSVRCGCGA
jgi:hypothetical protein